MMDCFIQFVFLILFTRALPIDGLGNIALKHGFIRRVMTMHASTSYDAKVITALLTPGTLRLHDNPVLEAADIIVGAQEPGSKTYMQPIIWPKETIPSSVQESLNSSISETLTSSRCLPTITSPHCNADDLIRCLLQAIPNYGDPASSEYRTAQLILVKPQTYMQPLSYQIEKLTDPLKKRQQYQIDVVNDNDGKQVKWLIDVEIQTAADHSLLTSKEDNTIEYFHDYKRKIQSSAHKNRPIWTYPHLQDSSSTSGSNRIYKKTRITNSINNNATEYIEDEDDALSLLEEYLSLGETQFSHKYLPRYLSMHRAMSVDRGLAVDRLSEYHHMFAGEVATGLLAPHLALGTLSTRLCLQSRRYLLPLLQNLHRGGMDDNRSSRNLWRWTRPWNGCELENIALRHEWHATHLPRNHEVADSMSTKTQLHTQWRKQVNHRTYLGHIQRDIVWQSAEAPQQQQRNSETSGPTDVWLVMVHGFGGSATQYESLASSLIQQEAQSTKQLTGMLAIDSLGFGRSAKPPLSYDQYLWRDQVQFTMNQVLEEHYSKKQARSPANVEVIVLGNSIGGFTAALVAQALTNITASMGSYTVKCSGLVLLNTAGETLPPNATSNRYTTEVLFPVYRGPDSQLLEVVGEGIIRILRPQIVPLCDWLYPANPPSKTKNLLPQQILRDSLDPGSRYILGAGGKLPPPLPLNDVFRQFGGPVLILQGDRDPLHANSSERGREIAECSSYEGQCSLRLLPLGHCPMDENSDLVATELSSWITQL